MTYQLFDAIVLGAGINCCGIAHENKLDLHKMNGTKLLHVFGGKLTIFLSLSRKAADLID
ncbi:MAG: hypothetical protein IIB95_06140 [Candidatus Marinimicrobia bacterium]|nr:hypothetical protein [Candidatus Neomarinimicrobiota bacterium]MCH7763307.1 hypothetical protein [Candidatus Neomarinimicrobiota bacterium]